MYPLANFIARHCRGLAALALMSVVIPALWLPKAQIDNSIEVWLRQDSVEFAAYREFLKRFGSEEFVVVAADTSDPLSDQSLAVQRDLAAKLGAVEGVEKVLDLPGVSAALWTNAPNWQAQARQNTFLRNFLLSADGRTVGLFVWLKNLEGPRARRHTVEAIERVVAEFAPRGFAAHLAGTPVMNVALDRDSERASKTFLPVAVALSIAVLVVMLRSLAGVVATMCAVGVTVVWTVGLLVMSGRTVNMVTVVLPALLFVLALSNGIHLASRFRAKRAALGDRDEALRAAVRELLLPSLLTSATTAVGFGSLIISDMKPVTDFGVFAAIGMLISLALNLLIVPGVLSAFHGGQTGAAQPARPHWSGRTVAALARRQRLVLAAAIVLLVLGVVAMTRLTVESNVLKFFPEHSRIARDYEFIGQKLTGFYTVELDVRSSLAQENATLQAMGKLAVAIAARPEVARVDHYGHFAALMPLAAVGELLGASKAAAGLPHEVSRRFRRVEQGQVSLRMSVLVRAMSSADFYSLLSFIRAKGREMLPSGVAWNITGVVSLLNDVQRSLVETQVKTFALSAVVVIVMMGVLFGSLRAGLASVLPNLLPVVSAFALMALVGIPLDAATVMVASVAIGIAVDNTIHFLACYRDRKRAGLEPVEASAAALSDVGSAMVFTSLVAAAGFSVLLLAEFRPVAYYGLLMAFTMLTALACDLLVTPVCARVCKV